MEQLIQEMEQGQHKDSLVFTLLESERFENGEYRPCIVTPGEPGYHRTGWQWGNDRALAQECVNDRNSHLSKEFVQAAIAVSMR